jgi:hypothetical protein
MKKYPLLLTIAFMSGFVMSLLPLGAEAATLGGTANPLPSSVAPDDTPTANPTDPTANPTFNPQGIQSILSNPGNLSNVFSGIVSAFLGLDPNIASALTTASKYAPIAQSVLAGQQPTPAQIRQVAAGMNGGNAIRINFGDYGLDAAGNIKPLNPDGRVKTDDPTGKTITYACLCRQRTHAMVK